MSRTYCHTHSAYDCQTCADEILSLGIQVDKDRIKWLESEVARLEACAAQAEPEEKLDFEKLESLGWQIAICAMCGTHASAIKPAQAVPVMGEPIPQDWKGVDGAVAWHLMDRHGEGWAHIGQMMDAWLAANSIPAAELATLRENAAMVDELQERAERMQKALSDIAEWTDRYTTPGHPVSTIARAAIAHGKGE